MSKAKVFSLADFASKTTKKKPKSKKSQYTQPVKAPNHSDDVKIIHIDPMKDVDIIRIHELVLKAYDAIEFEIQKTSQLLDELQKIDIDSIEDQVFTENKLLSAQLKLDQLNAEADQFVDYEDKARELIGQYYELVPEVRQRVVGTQSVVIESSLYSPFRSIVSEFVNLAQCFATNLKIVYDQANVDLCRKCNGSQTMIDSKLHCMSCGKVTNLKESSGSSDSTKNQYYRLETFVEHMAQYQGRQKKPIPPEVFQKIIAHCKSHRLTVGELSKSHIYRIMKEHRMNEYYNSLNSIAHSLTKAPLPDIRHLEKALIKRHRLVEEEWKLVRSTEKKTHFLYGWYVLRAFLTMEKEKFREEDFLVMSGRNALVETDKLMITICERIRERQKSDHTIKGNWNFSGLA